MTTTRLRGVLIQLSLALVCVAWPPAAFGAEANAADEAYRKAQALMTPASFAQAEAAFKKVIEDYPGTSAALLAMKQLWTVEAMLGKTDEAFDNWMRWKQAEYKELQQAFPVERAELDRLRAQARMQVADACSIRGTAEGLQNARLQLDRLIRDYPDSPLIEAARKRIAEIDRQIPTAVAEHKDEAAVEQVIQSYADSVNKADVQAVLALLSPASEKEKIRDKLEKYFQTDDYKASVPVKYRMKYFNFNADKTEVTVNATVETPSTRDTGKPGKKTFRLTKTPEGWKINM